VLIRLKSDIPLKPVSPILRDGSYIAEISGDGVSVTMRVIEYYADVEGQVVPEMCRVGRAARFPFGGFSARPPSKPGVRPFGAPGFPAIYAACVTGVAWMWSWQVAQMMSVLRRILAMSSAHAGCPGPFFPRCLSAAT